MLTPSYSQPYPFQPAYSPPSNLPAHPRSSLLSFSVSTLNVNSIKPGSSLNTADRYRKVDAILHHLALAGTDLAFFQETGLDPAVDYQSFDPPFIPPQFATLYSTRPDPVHPQQTRGRGLCIIAHPRLLGMLAGPGRPPVHLTLIDHITTSGFEILAARLGPLFVASIYVKITSSRPQCEHLITCLLSLFPPMCSHCVIGGDFNYPDQWEDCHHLFQLQLGLVSPVSAPFVHATHRRGNILDHILLSPSLRTLRITTEWLPEADHCLLTAAVSLPPVRPSSAPALPPPPPRLHTTKLRQFHRLSLLSDHKKPPKIARLQEQYKANVMARLTPPPVDLSELNRRLYDATADTFGVISAPRPIVRAYMYERRVRQAMDRRRQAVRHYNKVCHRGGGGVSSVAYLRLRAANHAYDNARRSAQRQAHLDLMDKIDAGAISVFWALFRQRRGARSPPTPPTKLDPHQVTTFFSSLYSSPDSAAMVKATVPPPDLHRPAAVSGDLVKQALQQLKDSATGPDGVPAVVFKHLRGVLAGPLCDLFSKCLDYGLPPSLRQGVITLLPKTSPPSSDPKLYRPITLLPVVVRLLLRVVDLSIRQYLDTDAFPFPIEQGGFMPKRCTHLQTFLLLLQRDHARHTKQALFVAFLDIEKAFDKIDHCQLLDILRSLPIPPELVHTVHRLLPDFYLSVYGVAFPQEQGTFQGGPLSPLLCILFLVDLILSVNGNSASAFHGVQLPWPSELLQAVLKMLLFADDIAILATSIPQLQLALNLLALWSQRRKLTFGITKCKGMRLARAPSDRRLTAELPPLYLNGEALDWVPEFPYLGHTIFEAKPFGRRTTAHSRVVPIDKKKVQGLCHALVRTFQNSDRCPRVNAMIARRGIQQVVHAKYLYPTPLLHIDYDTLDVAVGQALRRMFGLPLLCPLELIFADIGLLPSKYYAYERGLTLLWRLRHAYWTKAIFDEWFSTTTSPPIVQHSWAGHGVLYRFTSMLEELGLSWDHLHTSVIAKEWKQKVHEAVGVVVARELQQAAARHGMPEEYTRLNGTVLSHRYITGDLLCAVLRFRSPCLRLLPSYDPLDHGLCRFCRGGGETGTHLLFCPCLPLHLSLTRDQLLASVISAIKYPLPDPRTRQGRTAILPFFLNLALSGALSCAGSDASSRMVLEARLVKRIAIFYRDLLKTYASFHPSWEPAALKAYPVLKPRPLPASLFYQFNPSPVADLVDP